MPAENPIFANFQPAINQGGLTAAANSDIAYHDHRHRHAFDRQQMKSGIAVAAKERLTGIRNLKEGGKDAKGRNGTTAVPARTQPNMNYLSDWLWVAKVIRLKPASRAASITLTTA